MSLGELLSELEDVVVATLAGKLPDGSVLETFPPLPGDWNGRPLTLSTRFLAGHAQLDRIQIARVQSADDSVGSLTVVAVPTIGRECPLLGLDVVGFRDRVTFAALDLHPLDGDLAPTAKDQFASQP